MPLEQSNRYKLHQPVVETDEFIVGFPLFGVEDLTVYVDGVLNELFSVVATFTNGRSDDAVIQLVTAVSGVDVEIYGTRTPRRDDDYIDNSPALAQRLQEDADRLTAVQQEQARDYQSAIRVAPNAPVVAPLSGGNDDRADRVIAFNETGFGLTLGPKIGEIENAQGYAEDAGTSASEAAESAAAAAASSRPYSSRSEFQNANIPAPVIRSEYFAADGITVLTVSERASAVYPCAETNGATRKWVPSGETYADHFGANVGGGDGVSAINKAVAYVASIGGGFVHFLAGVYIAGASSGVIGVDLKGGVVLRGAGLIATELKLADGADAHTVHLDPKSAGNGVMNMTVNGNRDNQTLGVHCVRLQENDKPRLENVWIKGGAYYGIGIGYDASTENPVTNGRFVDIFISDCGNASTSMGDGFDAKRTKDCLFQNIQVTNCEQRGLDVRGEANIYDNIWAYNNGATGISFRALGTLSGSISEENYIKATNCYSFNNGDAGYFIASNEPPLTGFKCEYDLVNCHAFGNAAEGFLHRGTDCLVRYVNCTAKENGSYGFLASSTSSDTSLIGQHTNCQSMNNGNAGFLANAGIGPHQYTGCRSLGNSATDQVTIQAGDCSWRHGYVSAAGQTRGLYVTGNRCDIDGGKFVSGSTDALRIDGDHFNVTGARFKQDTSITCFRIAASADGGKVIACDFTEVTSGTPLSNGNSTTIVLGCRGISDPLKTEYSTGDVNYLIAKSASSSSAPGMYAEGPGANINYLMVPKGNGVLLCPIANCPEYADDAAAAVGGVPIGGTYRTGSVQKIRVS